MSITLNKMPKDTNTEDFSINLDRSALEKSASLFRALAHPVRLEIVEMIHKNGSLNVTEIYQKLKLEQAIVSNHLAILRKKAILKTRREGKMIHYSVNPLTLGRVMEWQELVSVFKEA